MHCLMLLIPLRYEWMDGWMNEWLEEWMDGWTKMNGYNTNNDPHIIFHFRVR